MRSSILVSIVWVITTLLSLPHPKIQEQGLHAELIAINKDGNPVMDLVDGSQLQLRIIFTDVVQTTTTVSFSIAPGIEIGHCAIPANQRLCETNPLNTLGWFWYSRAATMPGATLRAVSEGNVVLATLELLIKPRPVVMVHGFSSSWAAWEHYLGQDGYLAQSGLQGFAVGDGQFPGVMDTGNIANPSGHTNTIAENASILGEYIEQVLEATGAERIDLLAHSMGGLISRYYIARIMPEGTVAQLIMLGSPMSGTDCANLPAALGFYLPATLEIQPSYVSGIFNPQIIDRKGVIFHALAGIALDSPLKSPCTPAPSDLAVSLQSVQAIPLQHEEIIMLHTELNTSAEVYNEFVLPRLQATPDSFVEPVMSLPAPPSTPLQFSRVFSGHLNQGDAQVLSIQIEPGVAVASFALFDTSQSLVVNVTGASGNRIELDPDTHGLIEVNSPESLVHLGYGFNNPRPGTWLIQLETTESTPPDGAYFALTAVYQGGAILQLSADDLLPVKGNPITITANLVLDSQALDIQTVITTLVLPDGARQDLPFLQNTQSDDVEIVFFPSEEGIYGIEILTVGVLPDGSPVERTGYLSFQAQPTQDLTSNSIQGLILAMVFTVILLVGVPVFFLRRRRHKLNR